MAAAVLLSFFCFTLDFEPVTWRYLTADGNEIRQEITYLLYMTITFGLYHKLFILWTALPFGRRFVEEYQSHSWYFYLQRSGSFHYACRRVLGAGVLGGITASGGMFLTFALLWLKKFPFYTKDNPVIHKYCGYVSLLYEGAFDRYVFVFLILFFLSGMILAAMAATVSVYIPNKYVVLAVPYLIYRSYLEFAKAARIPDRMRLDWIFSGRIQPLGVGTSLVLAICIAILLLELCIFIFRAGVKRRLINGK